jgi:hypothetical protein
MLDSSREAFRLSTDRFIIAVAQLAGVNERQVTLLPLSAASGGVAASLTLASPLPASVPASGDFAASEGDVTNGRNNLRRLASDSKLEVRCRIQAGSVEEASDVTRHVSNAARQARFARKLSDSGLQLVPDSLSMVTPDGTKKLAVSSSNAAGSLRVHLTTGILASLGAVLLLAMAA